MKRLVPLFLLVLTTTGCCFGYGGARFAAVGWFHPKDAEQFTVKVGPDDDPQYVTFCIHQDENTPWDRWPMHIIRVEATPPLDATPIAPPEPTP